MVNRLVHDNEATRVPTTHPSRLSRSFRSFHSRSFLPVSFSTAWFAVQQRSRIPLAKLLWCISSLKAWTHEFFSCRFSLSPLEVVAAFGSVSELLRIIRSLDFDSDQFSTQVTDLKRFPDICDRIVKKWKQSWPIGNLSRSSHDVFTLSVVVPTWWI